jgi:hypothetical protein
MPHGVINVGRVDDTVTKPFLEEPAESFPYIALSYCWGETQARKTLKNNIEEHLRGIPLLYLLQTIKDAIAVARLLRVWYFLVDMPCVSFRTTKKIWCER